MFVAVSVNLSSFFLIQLRNHLNNAIKHQGQPNTVNLTNPETLQLHLETRLAQLESAINMELWQVCVLSFHFPVPLKENQILKNV